MREKIVEIVDDSGNCSIANPCNPELACCECQANAILALEVAGMPLSELIGKAESGKLVELDEDQTHPLEYWTTTKLHPEGTNTTNHVIPKGVVQAYEQADFQRVKPQTLVCKGINCDQYTYRCIAYGEPADNCPLGWGESR